jgi:hypothetical protein
VSAAADKGSFTSLVAQLDDLLMKEIIGSLQEVSRNHALYSKEMASSSE